jgi:hypothetical protein
VELLIIRGEKVMRVSKGGVQFESGQFLYTNISSDIMSFQRLLRQFQILQLTLVEICVI